jgi:hypothetical protein
LNDFVKIPINGSFFIGWRQLDQASLNVGFDRNTISNDKIFYSVDNGASWINSRYEGSLMIRPIFSTNLNKSVGLSDLEDNHSSFYYYPNPVNSVLYVETNDVDYKGVEILDLNGKIVLQSPSKTINIEPLDDGVYLLRNKSDNNTYKIIIN